MTAFRPLDPFQVYTDLNGNLAAGGNLHFYAAGTTTDADVYGDEGLTVNNGPSIAIGTDGRAVDDIWADGTKTYRCRVYGADGTLIRDRDNIGVPGSGGLVIPSLVANEFLTNDGAVLLWSLIRQLPDPTGQANKILSNDGTNATWIAQASAPVVTPGGSGNIVIGGVRIQWGNAVLPASGTQTANVNVTFGTPFSAAPYAVSLTQTAGSGAFSSGGGMLMLAATTQTSSGFTCFADGNTGFDTGTPTITRTTPFQWIAFGPA